MDSFIIYRDYDYFFQQWDLANFWNDLKMINRISFLVSCPTVIIQPFVCSKPN